MLSPTSCLSPKSEPLSPSPPSSRRAPSIDSMSASMSSSSSSSHPPSPSSSDHSDHAAAATNLAFEASLSPPYSPPEMKVQIGPMVGQVSNRGLIQTHNSSLLAVQDLAKVKLPIPKVTKPGMYYFRVTYYH